jgi:hypothetical protein
MLHIADKAAFQNCLADLPVVTYQPGETVNRRWFEDWSAADPQEGQCRVLFAISANRAVTKL